MEGDRYGALGVGTSGTIGLGTRGTLVIGTSGTIGVGTILSECISGRDLFENHFGC